MKHQINIKKVKIYLIKILLYLIIIYLGFKSDRSQRLSQISTTDPNIEEYWFVCRQWFDKHKGDKQTIRELLPTDADGNILSNRNGNIHILCYKKNLFFPSEVIYMVHVFTGDKNGAGTDANVFLTIYGEHEDSGRE